MDLLDLLDCYPILESFASQLTFGDLLALSRTSSTYRCTLRGLALPQYQLQLVHDTYKSTHRNR
jgi:hypothetical protein